MIRNRLIGGTAAAVLVLPALLAGCGSSDGGSGAADSSAAATVTLSGVAADGPLQGATACYDLNDNGACDAPAEPTAGTDANGRFSFEVPAAEAGRHRVLVDVPATAIDRDTGAPVGTAFSLVSPATGSTGAPVFASPLTTLVQSHMDDTGSTLAVASDFIRAQAGLAISPLADYTAAGGAGNAQAGTVARLAVLTMQKEGEALATVSGQTDLSGSKITATELARAIRQAVVSALPALAAAAADPAVAAAGGTARQALLAAAADRVVAQTGLTPETVAAAVGVAKLPPDTSPAAATATAQLTALRYVDADNWLARTIEASAADNTPDAAGNVRYYSVYRESVSSNFSPNGVVHAWGAGPTLARAGDVHWNGSAWVGCPLGTRSTASKRDAQGRSSYEFCDRREEGYSVRSVVDLAGKPIAGVLRDTVRRFPGGANGVAYTEWGPADPAAAYGSAAFPAGSALYYQTNTVTRGAVTYDVQSSNVVNAFTAAVAAGGDARTASPACAPVTSANSTSFQSPVTTLDDLVARNPGRPCVYNKATTSDGTSVEPNEWWSNSTVSIGVVAGSQALPAGTGNYYTTGGALRVSFDGGGGNGVTFHHCLQRRADGSVRNCSAIGTGSYAIQALGDARVMSFSAQPALAQRLGYVRSFVERGGRVYFGFSTQAGAAAFLRLNLEATNAVIVPLGLPPVRPVTRAADFGAATAAALATARGAWGTATDAEALVLRFGESGRFLLGEAGAPNAATREQSGGELGWFDLDTATGRYATLVEVDSNLSAGTSHPGPGAGIAITPTQITAGDGTAIPRLGGSSGIVGLWALGSPSDLSVNHFAFFANGRMLHIDSRGDTEGGACAAARQGPAGAEFASYTFDPVTGTLRMVKIHDTDGCAGLFDSSAGAVAAGTANSVAVRTLVLSADGKTATVGGTGTSTPVTLYRIPPQ